MRFAKLVGRENVMAGADCGFSSQALYKTEVHHTVVWEKFKALRQGADLATKTAVELTFRRGHSTRIPVCRTSSRQSANSRLISSANCSGVLPVCSAPCRAAFLEVGRSEHLGDRGVEPCDDGGRRVGRRQQAGPQPAGVPRNAALRDGRKVRQRRRALGGRDREQPELAAARVRRTAAMVAIATCRLPASRSVTTGGLPRYGTCVMVVPVIACQQHHRHVRRGAGTGRAVGQFPGIVAGVREQLLHRLDRQPLDHREHVRNGRQRAQSA